MREPIYDESMTCPDAQDCIRQGDFRVYWHEVKRFRCLNGRDFDATLKFLQNRFGYGEEETKALRGILFVRGISPKDPSCINSTKMSQ